MMGEPEEMLSVEKRGENEWFCRMCTVRFDRQAWEMEEGCPGCADMSRAQERRQAAGLFGAL